MILAASARSARIALVPEGALLLAGDAIEIDVTVDPGAELELVETAGTVAFDMRGGQARWDVRADVRPGAALRWGGLPFVVAAGAEVSRATRIRCATGARLTMRETLVLGRHGEAPGVLRQSTTVIEETGRPLLVESLPLDTATSPLLLGGHRVLTSVLTLGSAVDDTLAEEHRFDLDEPGAVLWRRLGVQAHEASLDAVWDRLVAQ